MTTTSADPRIAPVEQNLLALFGTAADSTLMTAEPHDDVLAYRSDVPIPLFNAISGARFAPGREGERARAVLAAYVGRGLPFMWWLTPTTSSPAIEAALAEVGAEPEHVPGMHVSLAERPDRAAAGPGVTVTTAGPDDLEAVMATMMDGFEFPDLARQPMADLLGGVDPARMRHVLATVDGTPAATGSVWLTGTTAGLYNIATLPAYRGRGLGYAVTAALMDLARDLGCTEAVLHATELGRPVYERLGFVEVCRVPQWVWMPPG